MTHPMPPEPPPQGHLENLQERIEEIAEWYLEMLQKGEYPDLDSLASAHPELAGTLRRHLKFVEMMYEARQGP